jgi:large subunit ribosomal protein LP2
MKHVAAYMLAVLGGNASPSAADVKKILAAVDAKVDDAALDKVVSELSGKNLEEVIEAGQKKMASVSVAAPAAGGAAPAAGGGGGAAPAAKKAPEPEPEEDADMGFSLFD